MRLFRCPYLKYWLLDFGMCERRMWSHGVLCDLAAQKSSRNSFSGRIHSGIGERYVFNWVFAVRMRLFRCPYLKYWLLDFGMCERRMWSHDILCDLAAQKSCRNSFSGRIHSGIGERYVFNWVLAVQTRLFRCPYLKYWLLDFGMCERRMWSHDVLCDLAAQKSCRNFFAGRIHSGIGERYVFN